MEIVQLDGEETQGLFDQVVQIHKEAIHEGFLSTLGPNFLTALYRTLASGDRSFLIVAKEEEVLLGFICGSENTGEVYRDFMKRAGVKAIFMMLPKLFSIKRVKRIIETLLYPKKQKKEELPEPEILNFCVKKDTQGKGVGGRLFNELLTEFRRRDIGQIRIVTGEAQESAQRFYEAKGAILVTSIEVHKGTASRVYTYEVPST